MIIGLTGMPGSGKSTVSHYLQDKYKFTFLSMGDIVRRAMMDRNIKINDTNLRQFSEMLREKDGKDAVAKLSVEYINDIEGDICIDGIRGVDEVAYFKGNLKDRKMYVVAVSAPTELRYKRLLDRTRYDDPDDIKGLEERDRREIGFGVIDAISAADIIVSNVESTEKLYSDIDELVYKIRKNLV